MLAQATTFHGLKPQALPTGAGRPTLANLPLIKYRIAKLNYHSQLIASSTRKYQLTIKTLSEEIPEPAKLLTANRKKRFPLSRACW
jgi:hypothetical protein